MFGQIAQCGSSSLFRNNLLSVRNVRNRPASQGLGRLTQMGEHRIMKRAFNNKKFIKNAKCVLASSSLVYHSLW